MRQVPTSVFACSVVLFALIGCGGGASGEGSSNDGIVAASAQSGGERTAAAAGHADATGRDTVTARVGERGGTLELENGVKLEIPEGALSETVTIVLSRGAATDAFNNREDERAVGPVFNIAPELVAADGKTFRISVPLRHAPDGFEPSDAAIAFESVSTTQRGFGEEMGSTQTRWDRGPARYTDGQMTAEVSHLPGLRAQFTFSR